MPSRRRCSPAVTQLALFQGALAAAGGGLTTPLGPLPGGCYVGLLRGIAARAMTARWLHEETPANTPCFGPGSLAMLV